MGFGSGYSRKSDNGGKRYSNDMVAHVWNAQTESQGQSGNGNFFFRGPALYSYGTHFVVGYIMPDGIALMNGDSYSVSTSGHQSDARAAIKNRRHAGIKGLTDLCSDWKPLARFVDYLRGAANVKPSADARREMQGRVRAMLLEHATALSVPILPAGAWGYDSWDYDTTPATRIPFNRDGMEDVGAYLARLAGLPAATWPAIAKRRAALDAKRQREEIAKEAKRKHDSALRFATLTDAEWREQTAMNHARYVHSFKSMAKALYHAKRYAKAHGFSAKRLDVIRQRESHVRWIVDNFDSINATWRGREGLRSAIATFRACERLHSEVTSGGAAGVGTKEGATRKAIAALRTLSGLDVPPHGKAQNVRPFPRSACVKMWALADKLETETLPPLTAELAAEREREREAERARIAERAAERQRSEAERAALDEAAKADWLAGRPNPRRPYFDAPEGGAAMRIVGEELQTSHGADVPLAHAVKVFRFVKLCRDQGQSWARNGKTIRVGHFQVDRIDSSGDFVAGCHSFKWPEVERVAKLAGVFDCAPSADAVEVSHA